mmetsp:Transcript_11791/g.15394  ORF Transcript_11791/g.15394 Transcript_11791/m.15394 type:complete len:272 (-) Transcript_11791:271-1086(-)|eukprot:CAMPEP_0117756144 /NCGR_PEP_ID=MMETSP0947-20121206/13885_1 /TAXON_ID=44440 /ORGANISM="Chattonella subsalsa, Strain CCMP2191" /LENGTH=271 /DNA_ID=CAMNT_0005575639 /DNA_START=282 /DNA_END=1097 /DNA_ORIENTATION=+
MFPKIILVDKIEGCRSAVEDIKRCKKVSVDLEGTNLCRAGTICLIQMRGLSQNGNTPIYLFDIVALGKTAFEEGGLRSILENGWFEKIMFDCRGDADALFHLYGVRLYGVYDLQVLHTLMFSTHNDMYLKGLKKVLEDFFSSTISDPYHLNSVLFELKQVKESGKVIFDPAKGGSVTVWENRPLPQTLRKYAALDVQFLGTVSETWNSISNCYYSIAVKYISDMRVQMAIGNFQPSAGRYKVFRDFDTRLEQYCEITSGETHPNSWENRTC